MIYLRNNEESNPPPGLILALLVLGFFYYSSDAFKENQKEALNNRMNEIHQKVAQDAIDQYNIAKRSGTSMEAHVHAGLVAAAFLQAKDEENYRKWCKIRDDDGILAGIPPR